MRFSDLAKDKLVESHKQFGEYTYYDKGAHEAVDVDELVLELKKITIPNAIIELKHLAQRTDCPLDPQNLVCSILGSLDDNDKYDDLFEDEELVQYY